MMSCAGVILSARITEEDILHGKPVYPEKGEYSN